MGLIFILWFFIEKGFLLDLNIINFIFLMAGIALHRTPRRYLAAIAEAVRETGGIILQFPFYAGIMGMMASSGLGEKISDLFVSIPINHLSPVHLLSAGWSICSSLQAVQAVQGPSCWPRGGLGSARRRRRGGGRGDAGHDSALLGASLAIARLKADIMGYCVVVLLYSGLVIGLSFVAVGGESRRDDRGPGR